LSRIDDVSFPIMITEGFLYFLCCSHFISLLCLIPLQVATIRRLRSRQPISTILMGMCMSIWTGTLFHIVQFATILIHVPFRTGPLRVMTEGWLHSTNYHWCAFDALTFIAITTGLGHLGVVFLYVPFAIFISTLHHVSMPLVHTSARTNFLIIFGYVLLLPLVITAVYAGITFQLPQDQQFTLNRWHCMPNYKYNKWFAIFVTANCFFLGILSAVFAIYSLLQMRNSSGKFAEKAGSACLPPEVIVRSFLL
jgi:hypothetical protein